LNRDGVSLGASARHGQAKPAVPVDDRDDVALDDAETPKSRRILVAGELHDLGVLVPRTAGRAEAKPALGVHDGNVAARGGGMSRGRYTQAERGCRNGDQRCGLQRTVQG